MQVDEDPEVVAGQRHLRELDPAGAAIRPDGQQHLRPAPRDRLDQEDQRRTVEVGVRERGVGRPAGGVIDADSAAMDRRDDARELRLPGPGRSIRRHPRGGDVGRLLGRVVAAEVHAAQEPGGGYGHDRHDRAWDREGVGPAAARQLRAAPQAVPGPSRVESALRALAADGVGCELPLEGDQLLVGGRGRLQALACQFVISRTVEAVQLDREPGQLLQLSVVEAPKLPQPPAQPEPLCGWRLGGRLGARSNRLGLRPGGLGARRLLLGGRFGWYAVEPRVLQHRVDLLGLQRRERLLAADARGFQVIEQLAAGESAFLR